MSSRGSWHDGQTVDMVCAQELVVQKKDASNELRHHVYFDGRDTLQLGLLSRQAN